jgi:D-alanyl-lipoteichoic acid acyltransferase DltB (MBOAT superfamily)
MLFNSIEFLIYFPAVFIIYWLFFADKIKVRNFYLIIVSYIFYGWWDWRFLILIIISSYVDFYVGEKLEKENRPSVRKRLLFLSLAVNLGFLGFFKYFNFFADSFAAAFTFFGQEFHYNRLKIILPVGISFYTFQTMSYTFDIYRGKMKSTKSIIDFFAFVSFFPQLVAGPIERASHLLPQFKKKYSFEYERTVSGFRLILWGMFKKVVVADRLSAYVDAVYNNIPVHSGLSFYIATLFFAFQIYCDFSGYSDIAIGTARSMGFDLMTNFRTPYFAVSFKDFWNRWHISLSTWFRDYLYIPLGGNRCSKKRQYFNLFTTFLVSGLWHGANWTFVVWGALHGVYQMIEKAAAGFWREKLSGNKIIKRIVAIISVFTVFHLVNLAWIFFRADNLHSAFDIINKIFSVRLSEKIFIDNNTIAYSLLSLLILLIIDYLIYSGRGKSFFTPKYRYIRKISYAVFILYIIATGVFNEAQFIYFQF